MDTEGMVCRSERRNLADSPVYHQVCKIKGTSGLNCFSFRMMVMHDVQIVTQLAHIHTHVIH